MLYSVYQERINEYYVPLLFLGLVVMASVFMYKQSNPKHKQSHPIIPSLPSTTYQYSNSSCSSSHISISTQISKYRKSDPETRYDDDGTRYQCVSIPYRVVTDSHSKQKRVEILMITSRAKGDYIYPGGGWEWTETGPECAQREAFEEGGIKGIAHKEIISDMSYVSDKGNKSRMWGYLMEVEEVLDVWPEPDRRRKWMSIDEADIALSKKRRKKFGSLWTESVQYFTLQNLYKKR